MNTNRHECRRGIGTLSRWNTLNSLLVFIRVHYWLLIPRNGFVEVKDKASQAGVGRELGMVHIIRNRCEADLQERFSGLWLGLVFCEMFREKDSGGMEFVF